jgi:hypothetical protein
MSIKKAYTSLVSFLQANQDKTVSDILDEVVEMCSAKSAGSSATTVHKNEEGVVTHIRCGFFKQWLPLSHVEFGTKSSSASGYNSMSKAGQSIWTKKQRDAKKAREELLDGVASGDVDPSDLAEKLEAIEAERTEVVPHPLGADTLEEALAYSAEELDNMAEAAA